MCVCVRECVCVCVRVCACVCVFLRKSESDNVYSIFDVSVCVDVQAPAVVFRKGDLPAVTHLDLADSDVYTGDVAESWDVDEAPQHRDLMPGLQC